VASHFNLLEESRPMNSWLSGQMKIVFAAAVATLALAMPASANVITIEFTSIGVPPGDNGGVSLINWTSSTQATGSNLAISEMIVSGDGSFDGTYAVTGNVAGFGSLNFDTSSNLVQIVGGVTIGAATIPDGTALLTGTGPFTNVLVTAGNCVAIPSHLCPTVTFDAPNTINATLLSDLGSPHNVWELSSFDTGEGTSNTVPQTSADVLNTNIPEPGSMAVLGTALVGLGLMWHRRKSV
jgi:PEP-CTERM motif